MTTYNVKFINNTKEPYHFAIYQHYPESPGLHSVAFQVRGVPANAFANATWVMKFGTSITEFDPNGKNWTGEQIQEAQLESKYEIKMVEGDIPTINPVPVGSTGSGNILLQNTTSKKLNVGFTVDNSLVAVQEVKGGEASEYYVHPTYYVATFRNIQQGSLVDSGVVLGPKQLKFADGYTSYVVEAAIDGGKYILKEPVPVS